MYALCKMPMWSCNFEHCTNPAVRIEGNCILCNRHLCDEHLQPINHECPKWEDATNYDAAEHKAEETEIFHLIASINTFELAERASTLRKGVKASIAPLQYDREIRNSVMGGMNYHIEIQFEDGVTWLARIRRFNATSPPPSLRDFIMRSEVATLKFLESTTVPAPKVYDFALESDSANTVGVGYILMEKMPGKPFLQRQGSEHVTRRVTEQLANIYLELRKWPFDKMGSLSQPGTSTIGPFAHESYTDFEGSKMKLLEPTVCYQDYAKKSIELILDLIQRKEMYANRSVNAFLVHRFLLDLIPHMSAPQHDNAPKFYLTHPDDKGDHILTDEAGNITAILDWESAYTAPAEEAFNSPMMLFDVGKFFTGEQAISEREAYLASCLEGLGSTELASAARNGRSRHFFRFCRAYPMADWSGFVGVFRGLRESVGVDAGLDWDEWREVALERYEEDDGLRKLLGMEDGKALVGMRNSQLCTGNV